MRTTITVDDRDAEAARRLGVNLSAAARDGITAAVRHAQEQADRLAYTQHPETVDEAWGEVEAWGEA